MSVVIFSGLGASCADDRPTDDVEYLVWEVCRQIRAAGTTVDQVSGILHDASRHGPIMDRIEAECGSEIAAIYDTTIPTLPGVARDRPPRGRDA